MSARTWSQAIAHRVFAFLFARVALKREPDFIVGERLDPYLMRWRLVPKNPLLNLYLHCFMRSDDARALHDHPWPSCSFTLEGCVLEHTIDAGGIRQIRGITAGDVRLRGARFAHRLELPRNPIKGYSPPCWTLILVGPRVRRWGFHCENAGWIPFEVFTDTDAGQSINGRGCG